MAAKLTSIADGSLSALPGGLGAGHAEIVKKVDFSEYPSTTTDFRYIVPLPAGTTFGTWFMKVLTADGVSAATIDVGDRKSVV